MKKLTHLTAVIVTSMLLYTVQASATKTDPNNEIPEAEIDECQVEGLFYTVQLGVFSQPVSDEDFPEISEPIYCIQRQDGLYAYFAGVFDNRFDAMTNRYDVVSQGLYEAYVAVYYNGEQISMPQADELIAEHGTNILYNSAKQEDHYTQKPE